MKLVIIALFFISSFAQAANHCERYQNNEAFMTAIATQAERMKYTLDELCHLPRLMDIYVVDTIIVNEKNEEIPHIWLTLHYSENSCQYFLRADDYSTTKKNCYNTW